MEGLIKRLRVARVEIKVSDDPGLRVGVYDRATPVVTVSRGFLDRPAEELIFVLSRSLEWVRSGSLLFLDREEKEREELLLELACALGVAVERTNVSSDHMREWRDWLGRGFGALNERQQSEIMAALKESVGRREDLGSYLAAQNQMAQRVGLMACGDLSVALWAAALEVRGAEVLEPSALESREALLSGDPGMAELVRFGVSEKRKKILRSSTITGY